MGLLRQAAPLPMSAFVKMTEDNNRLWIQTQIRLYPFCGTEKGAAQTAPQTEGIVIPQRLSVDMIAPTRTSILYG